MGERRPSWRRQRQQRSNRSLIRCASRWRSSIRSLRRARRTQCSCRCRWHRIRRGTLCQRLTTAVAAALTISASAHATSAAGRMRTRPPRDGRHHVSRHGGQERRRRPIAASGTHGSSSTPAARPTVNAPAVTAVVAMSRRSSRRRDARMWWPMLLCMGCRSGVRQYFGRSLRDTGRCVGAEAGAAPPRCGAVIMPSGGRRAVGCERRATAVAAVASNVSLRVRHKGAGHGTHELDHALAVFAHGGGAAIGIVHSTRLGKVGRHARVVIECLRVAWLATDTALCVSLPR
ncbi:hypothetical protein BC831DRAFT_440369 [Entophlyctis helioformis]|nr:hypothetical protein BC831DRAFT_440369 [Entophlyctis helioformis]